MTELMTVPADELDSAIRRVLSQPRPEPDPITALELATLRRDVRTYAELHSRALADAVAIRYELLDLEARAEAAELEAYQQACGASNLAIENAALKAEAAEREGHIGNLAGRLEMCGAELGQARERIAELEETLTRRLEEIDQLGRRLAEALDEGRKAPPARVVMPGGPRRPSLAPAADAYAAQPQPVNEPATFGTCPYCGQELTSARSTHVRQCPKNPDRTAAGGRPPKTAAPPVFELADDGLYICPLCGEAAFAKAPTLDLCIRCARGSARAAA